MRSGSIRNRAAAIAVGVIALLALAGLSGARVLAAAGTFSLFDDATQTANGVQLRSAPPPAPGDGGVNYTPTPTFTFAQLTVLSTDFQVLHGDCAAGSPRFQINIDGKNVFVYLGPSPNFTGCGTALQNSGNLVGNNDPHRYDTSQYPGGTVNGTYATTLALLGTHTITGFQLVVDSGFFFADKTQTILVNNIKIGTAAGTSTFTATTAPTKTCSTTTPTVGNPFTCTLTLTGPLAAGSTVQDQVTAPAGSVIVPPCTSTGGLTCGAPVGNTITATCTTACATGDSFTITIISPATGALTESVTVTPTGAAPLVFAVAPAAAVGVVFGTPVTNTAIGCANANVNTAIQFPTQPNLAGGFVVSSSNQIPNAFTTPSGNAQLSVLAPQGLGNGFGGANLSAVLCGAVFQDNDASPNLIDGGTITFALGANGQTANGLSIGQILESNGQVSAGIPCGSVGFVLTETCQGANTVSLATGAPCVAATTDCVAEPTPSNTVHVALRQGVSFSFIGGFAPALTISARYDRFQAYGAPFSISTGSATIGLATPTYFLSLTPSPATIPAALGSTTGSVITA
ncbi:MAG: hypothetical protein ACYDCQ_20655, partial [Dehalococcoidia bacterium]